MRRRDGHPLQVLVVDDDPVIRRGLTLILRSEPGVIVVGEARDGADAIEQVERLEPDLVLMDLRMPGLDGLEATRRLKAHRPDLRVIILSVYADRVEAALAAGAERFLLKDTSVEQLIGAVLAGRRRREVDERGEGKWSDGHSRLDTTRDTRKGELQ